MGYMGNQLRKIGPGLIFCMLIGIGSLFAADWFPNIGAGTIAILSGIILGNLGVSRYSRLDEGTKFSESTLLYTAIILLGATISFQAIAAIGWNGLLFILLIMMSTIIAALWIGKRMELPEDFRMLMASGNAVCGSSAIAATAPVIGADDKQKGLAITMVNLTGTVLMLGLPWLVGQFYHDEITSSSALIGGVLQSVGQVVASGSMVSEEVKDQAAIFKIVRILLLAVVISVLVSLRKKRQSVTKETKWYKIPWYIKGFFILCTINTFFVLPEMLETSVKKSGNFLEITALAGIGLRVKFADLIAQGAKAGLYTVLLASCQIGAAIILILLLF